MEELKELSDYDLLELCHEVINLQCVDNRWKMSFPPQKNDSDVLLSELCDRFKDLYCDKYDRFINICEKFVKELKENGFSYNEFEENIEFIKNLFIG